MTDTPSDALPRCQAHEGRHPVYFDQCVVLGAEVPRPYVFRTGRCDTCGAALDLRRDRQGHIERLESGTDRSHHHAPPIAVHLDADELAVALAQASETLRQRRLTSPPSEPPDPRPSTQPRPPSDDAARRQALGGIPTLTADG